MSDLLTNLKTTLDNFGGTKRTAPPMSQDPLDNTAHEFVLAAFIRSYGEKRYERAKEALLPALGVEGISKLETAKGEVKKNTTTHNVALASAQFYNVGAAVKIGASYLDTDTLKAALKKRLDPDEVDRLFTACTKRRDPTVTYMVTEKL